MHWRRLAPFSGKLTSRAFSALSVRSRGFARGRLMPRLGLATAFGLTIPLACADELAGVGLPCERFTDCPKGLFCDLHEGRGSCQPPHGHETGLGESGTSSEESGDGG